MYEDEIDLRYYVGLLLKRWKWIVLGGVIAALAAFAVSQLQPTTYETTASVAVVRTRTDVSFNENITALDDYELGGGRLASDRLTALVALAGSNEVLARVMEEVGGQLRPAERTVNRLRRMMDTTTTGDLIEFTVRHEDPEIAMRVANSWAPAYVRYANRLYGSSGDDAEMIATQVATARQEYETAQQALQDFLADEDVLALTRRLEHELAIKTQLLEGYQQALVSMEANEANELAQIEVWLADAETLRDQVRASPGSVASSVGDLLALIMLRSRVYGVESEEGGPVALQLDLTNVQSEGIRLADVENLIQVLERRREATRERIADLTAATGTTATDETVSTAGEELSERTDALTSEIIELETRLENETAIREAQRLELEAARDRAWDAYQALTARQVEAEIQARSSSTEVRVADSATIPTMPAGLAVLTNTLLAGIVGVMVAVGIVFFLAWWFGGAETRPTGSEQISYPDDRSGSEVDPNEPVQGRRHLHDTAA